MRSDIRLDLKSSDPQRHGSTIAFAISYQGADPDTVAQVTNALAFSYVEENLKARERQATGTSQFLKVQLHEVRKRLDGQEQQVSQFKRRHLGELPQQLDTSLGIIDRLDSQLRLNIDNQGRLGERREALAKRAAQLPTISETPTGPGGDHLERTPASPGETLARLQQELRTLRTRYTDKHPDVIRVRSAIADLEQELGQSPAPLATTTADSRSLTTPNPRNLSPADDELAAELRALKAEERRLRDSIAIYVSRVQNTPKLEQELKELSRDYDSTKELYSSLSKRYEEAELAESMEQRQKGEQFRILDAALPSTVPSAPRRLRLLLISGVLSLGLAIGAVVLAEELDTSFHSRENLRAFTSVRVIALPRIVLDADVRRRRWRLRLAAFGTTLALSVIVGLSYFLAHGNERLLRW
jgi:polysaccharide chain length determinant protein (PEP-CTERM system associated)